MSAAPPTAGLPVAGAPPAATRERLLTWPLVVFLLAVALLVSTGLRQRGGPADLPAAVHLLADGDLEGAQRRQLLAWILGSAPVAGTATDRWTVLLAAIAAEDRVAYAAALARLGGGAMQKELPPAADRDLLHLGEPMLGNVLAAAVAEAAGDLDGARRCWQLVAAQGRLARHQFAGELAAEALVRLPAPR